MKKKSIFKINTLSLISRYFLYSFVFCFLAVLFVGGSLIKWVATSRTNAYDINYFRSDFILMTFLFVGMMVLYAVARNKLKFYSFSFGLFASVWLALVYYHIGVFL